MSRTSYLDGTGRPDVWIVVGTFQVTEPFLFDWTVIGLANDLHSWEFREMAVEIGARISGIESKSTFITLFL